MVCVNTIITYSHQMWLLKLIRMQIRQLKTISGGAMIKVTISHGSLTPLFTTDLKHSA